MKMMDEATFNAFMKMAINGVIRQGKPAIKVDKYGNRKCMYRAPNNTACAIGQIIPDSSYDEEMDIRTLPPKRIFEMLGYELTPEQEDSFDNLQLCHDQEASKLCGSFVEGFKFRLKEFKFDKYIEEIH